MWLRVNASIPETGLGDSMTPRYNLEARWPSLADQVTVAEALYGNDGERFVAEWLDTQLGFVGDPTRCIRHCDAYGDPRRQRDCPSNGSQFERPGPAGTNRPESPTEFHPTCW